MKDKNVNRFSWGKDTGPVEKIEPEKKTVKQEKPNKNAE